MNADFFEAHSVPLPTRLAVGLHKLGLAMKQQTWGKASTAGLSPTQGQLLALLATAPDSRAGLLAQRLGLTAATVSDSIKALVEKGLVEKRGDAQDARASLLRLTDAGVPLARQATGWPEFLARAVDSLDEDEQRVMFKGLLKMIRTLQRRGDIPASRMCLTCTHFRPHVHSGAKPHHCAFVDAPFGDRHLRLECNEHLEAAEPAQDSTWDAFTSG